MQTVYLILSVEGTAESCEWQLGMLHEELKSTVSKLRIESDGDAGTGESGASGIVADYCRRIAAAQSPTANSGFVARLKTLPSRVVPVLQSLSAANCQVFGRAGNGQLFVRQGDSTGGSVPDAEQVRYRLQSFVADGIGELEILMPVAVPAAGRADGNDAAWVSSGGQTVTSGTSALAIVQGLRHTFDPQRVFATNP